MYASGAHRFIKKKQKQKGRKNSVPSENISEDKWLGYLFYNSYLFERLSQFFCYILGAFSVVTSHPFYGSFTYMFKI